jgi:hypothetical protein
MVFTALSGDFTTYYLTYFTTRTPTVVTSPFLRRSFTFSLSPPELVAAATTAVADLKRR